MVTGSSAHGIRRALGRTCWCCADHPGHCPRPHPEGTVPRTVVLPPASEAVAERARRSWQALVVVTAPDLDYDRHDCSHAVLWPPTL